MTFEAQESAINGELIRLTRESRGWALGDLATRSCMSIRQIRQLEEGGTSSFYSPGVKVTAAKRVAALLGLSQEQVFASSVDPHAEPEVASSDPTPVTLQPDAPLVRVSPNVMVSQAESDALTDVSLQAEDAPEVVADLAPHHTPATPSRPAAPEGAAAADLATASTPAPTSEPSAPADKPKVSFGAILFLFAAAIGVAALMRPELEPVSVEASPPVVAMPDVAPPDPSTPSASAAVAPAESASSAASSALTKSAPTVSSGPAVVNASAAVVAQAQPRAPTSSASSSAQPAPSASGVRPVGSAPAAAASAPGSSSKAP